MIVNKRELTRILGITAPTLAVLIERHGDAFPVVSKGSRGQDWQFEGEDVLAFLAEVEERGRRSELDRKAAIDQMMLPLGHNGGPPLEENGQRLRPSELLAMMKVQRLQREEAVALKQLVSAAAVQDTLVTVFHTMWRVQRRALDRVAADQELSAIQHEAIIAGLRGSLQAAVDQLRSKFEHPAAAGELADQAEQLFR